MSGRAGTRRAIDGVLLLDKPLGITSQRAVSRVKALTGAAKVGHTGTLDPLATGLLPLTFGEATKFSHALLDADKRYEAIVQLGVTTSTGDAEGEVLRREPVTAESSQIEAALRRFVGDIEQTPPMYSALKHAGKPLYQYARSGIEIERRARQVRIHSLVLIARHDDCLTIRVDCSKGTYIRVLAEDIGAALGCGASLAALRRTGVGRFSAVDSIDLATLEALPESDRAGRILPIDTLVADLQRVDLAEADATRLLRGQSVEGVRLEAGLTRVYAPDHRFIGLADASADGLLTARRLVSTGAQKP